MRCAFGLFGVLMGFLTLCGFQGPESRLVIRRPPTSRPAGPLLIRIEPRSEGPCEELAASRPCTKLAHWRVVVDGEEHGTRTLRESAKERATRHKKEIEKLPEKDANDPQVPTTLEARIAAGRDTPFYAVLHVLEQLAYEAIYRIEYETPSGRLAVWLPLEKEMLAAKGPKNVMRVVIESDERGGEIVRKVSKFEYPDAPSLRAGFVKKWNEAKPHFPTQLTARFQIGPNIPWGEVMDLLGAANTEKITPIEFMLARTEGVLPEPYRPPIK